MSTQHAARPRLHQLAERIGQITALDGPAEAVAKWARGAIPKGPVKDTLSGVPIGHAAHPLLIVLPVGTWTSATLLDLVGGQDSRPAARRLIAAGVLASLPAAASGLSDWADTTPAERQRPPRRRRPCDRQRHRARPLHRLLGRAPRREPWSRRRARPGGHGRGQRRRPSRRAPVLRRGRRGGPDRLRGGARRRGRTCWRTPRWAKGNCAGSRRRPRDRARPPQRPGARARGPLRPSRRLARGRRAQGRVRRLPAARE